MKISKMILMAGAVIALASCGGNSEAIEDIVGDIEMTTLSVDSENSSLNWKGMKSADYYHTGTVDISEGSAEFIDGNLTSGSFTIDMGSIAVTDETPDDKKPKLVGHLGTEEFFNIAENKTVSVTCGAMSEGNLPITIMMSGIEINQNIPVDVTYEDGKGSISGTFDVDFSSLNAVGFQPAEGEEEHVQPVVTFDLKLMLK